MLGLGYPAIDGTLERIGKVVAEPTIQDFTSDVVTHEVLGLTLVGIVYTNNRQVCSPHKWFKTYGPFC